MPTNIYGPGDNYDLNGSHVLPALIRKFHEAKESRSPTVTCWGTGSPRREFLYSTDLASACHLLIRHYDGEDHINVGSGTDVTIKELAETVRDVIGYSGEIVWDVTKPDGTPRKLLDSSKIKSMGWVPRMSLTAGIKAAYDSYLTARPCPQRA
jgi:GDP-L-fucose synthase